MSKISNCYVNTTLVIFLLFLSIISANAQISLTPSTLSWTGEETVAKSIVVNCTGSWWVDSTRVYNYVTMWKYDGVGGAEVEIIPLGKNTGYTDHSETITFHDAYGNTADFTFFQERASEYLYGDGTPIYSALTPASYDSRGDADSLCAWLSATQHPAMTAGHSVGRIPLVEGTTPTGGRTASLQVPVAAGFRLTPQLALSYNSQGGAGLAGQGWGLSGLPCINIISASRYYHGLVSPADADSAGAVFALDGVPLVANTDAAMSGAYPLVTARGNIMVRRHDSNGGTAAYFEAAYPDGTRATFGWSGTEGGRCDYPLTELTDRYGNRLTVEYTSPQGGEEYIPTAIRYGYVNGNATAKMELSYGARPDAVPAYRAGRRMAESLQLQKIVSLDGADTLSRISLSHEYKDGTSLLKGIVYGVDAQTLPPYSFTYISDEAEGVTSMLQYEETLSLAGVLNGKPRDYFLKRGKFIRGRYGDGLVAYVNALRYTGVVPDTLLNHVTEYESGYPAAGKLVVVPDLRSSGKTFVTMGSGFQEAECVDTDGDGADELVKVNYSAVSANGTDILITVYGQDASGAFAQLRSGTVTLPGCVSIDGHLSPVEYDAWWGDFDADGCVEMVCVTRDEDRDGDGVRSASRTVLIRLDAVAAAGSAHHDVEASTQQQRILAVDTDGDGMTELCSLQKSDGAMAVYRWDGVSHCFTLYRSITDLAAEVFTHDGPHLADINGDGYLDFVVVPDGGTPWAAYLGTGKGYARTPVTGPSVAGGVPVMLQDVNRDGLADAMVRTYSQIILYINEGGNTLSSMGTVPLDLSPSSLIVPCCVMDVYGIGNLFTLEGTMLRSYGYTRDRSLLRLMRSSDDGTGNVSAAGYRNMAANGTEVYGVDATRSYSLHDGFSKACFPVYLLSAGGAVSGETLTAKSAHAYGDAAFNNRGLGFCGFGSISKTDLLAGTVTESTLDPEKFGAVSAQSVRLTGSNTPFSTATYTYDTHTGIGGKADPRLVQSTQTDALTGVTSASSYSYDTYDCPTQVTTTRRIGVNGTPQTETVQTTYSHSTTDSLYLLGTATQQTLTRDTDGNAQSLWKTRTATTYDASYNPTDVKTYTGTTGTALQSEQTYTYDARGHVLSKGKAAYGATTFNTDTYTYDTNGRYLTSSTDATGRTATYQSYDRYGNPARSTDWLSRSTGYGYDVWGAPTRTVHPDGTTETQTRAWSTGSEPGLYCITTSTTGQPDTKVWYDALGREVRSANKRFDGNWQYVTTEYDSLGRQHRTSLPYKDTVTGPTLWNTYAYDTYNRPTVLTEASGKQTTWNYSGTSTTTVRDSLATTSTTDAEGNVVSVTDAGGTISYALRDDGQPSGVTVTPYGTNQNIVTTFQYDSYGRRTAIIDPSAGTRTDAYTDNADGTSSVAHSGPNGTVTTCYDRFGRVTSVTRPEFNTAYTYGTTLGSSAYGKLLSEVSTNGTSRSFTYDGYGRPLTETEHADSTHWLQKTYTYGAGSNVASISYAAQDGSIATETFTYAYGHNTAITATGPGNTTINVFTLTAENDLGLPTAVSTGAVSRTYAYTAAGLPQRRRLYGAQNTLLQDFEYSYNTDSGNMSWRKDHVLGMTEGFYYDGLNRLVTATQAFGTQLNFPDPPYRPYEHDSVNAGYDSKGNVLAKGWLQMSYADADDPYLNTDAPFGEGEDAEDRVADMVMGTTSFDRPSYVGVGNEPALATYEYNASGQKVRSTQGMIGLERLYLGGGVYERDSSEAYGSVQRLFLGGGAYDAPMVLVKEGQNPWTAYNIGRDVQGSITHVATEDGVLRETYYYDPWGNVTPMDGEYGTTDTLAVMLIDGVSFYSRIIGSHGYTGHEVIAGLGVYNANARLYDPVTGRFLAPDPLIQDPASTQDFNRYTYCLNNPLKYTDPDGESIILACLAAAGISMAIDYGVQVAMNYIAAKNQPDVTSKDIWFNNIDWFDIAISGIVGGLTGGYGRAIYDGKAVGKIGLSILKHTKELALAETVLTSAVDITGNGFQKVTFKQFGTRVVITLAAMSVTELITKRYTYQDNLSEKIRSNLDEISKTEIPSTQKQRHHFATNKNKHYTPQLEEIASKYGLDLDGEWNIAVMDHLGRHPNRYHDFVLQRMRIIDELSIGDTDTFLYLYELYVKQVIINNPRMLRKAWWVK